MEGKDKNLKRERERDVDIHHSGERTTVRNRGRNLERNETITKKRRKKDFYPFFVKKDRLSTD